MLSQQAKSFFSGRKIWTSVAVFALLNIPVFGQPESKQFPVWSKPSSSVPKEFLRAYVGGITKVGYELRGSPNWFDRTGWLVDELYQIDDHKLRGGIPFPGSGVGDREPPPVVGFIAVHVPSRKLKFLSNPTSNSNKWRISLGHSSTSWPDGNLAITAWPTAKSSERNGLVWKWHLASDQVSLVGRSIGVRSVPSLVRALDGTSFSLDWPAKLAPDWNRRLRLRHTCADGSIELALQNIRCKVHSPSQTEVFLPGSNAKELINIRESPLCDGQMIRCLEFGSTVKEKWKLTSQRIAEVTGESFWSIGVPKGLARPCGRIPLMIGDYSKAKIWILDTKTGKLTAGWSHPTFSGSPFIRYFGTASADGKLLGVEAKRGFYLFQVDTGKILYRPSDTWRNLRPGGIDKHGKVIATSYAGVWTLAPPYSKAPAAIFRLRLPPGWP